MVRGKQACCVHTALDTPAQLHTALDTACPTVPGHHLTAGNAGCRRKQTQAQRMYCEEALHDRGGLPGYCGACPRDTQARKVEWNCTFARRSLPHAIWVVLRGAE